MKRRRETKRERTHIAAIHMKPLHFFSLPNPSFFACEWGNRAAKERFASERKIFTSSSTFQPSITTRRNVASLVSEWRSRSGKEMISFVVTRSRGLYATSVREWAGWREPCKKGKVHRLLEPLSLCAVPGHAKKEENGQHIAAQWKKLLGFMVNLFLYVESCSEWFANSHTNSRYVSEIFIGRRIFYDSLCCNLSSCK